MKYYTEALVNDKKKKRVSAFFLGDRRRTSYYQARHREEDLCLLWGTESFALGVQFGLRLMAGRCADGLNLL